MTKRVALLISMGILLMASGCSKTQQQVSADTKPATKAAAVAPAPAALPPISGHWTITFKQLRQEKDGSFIPGTDKNFGVLNVDLKDGVNVLEVGLDDSFLCSQNGDVYKNKFHDLNFLVFRFLGDNGKPNEACFTSVGSFDGSSGQLSHTASVLAMADDKMQRQFKNGAPVPDAPMEREVKLKIQSVGGSGSFRQPPAHSFEAYTGVSGNMMSGMWCVATPPDGSRPSPYCGTLSGQRTSD